MHTLPDASGHPIRFILTAGQANDAKWAEPLLEGVESIETGHVTADKGCDSGKIVRWIEGIGANAVIPPRSNRKVKRE